MKGKGREYAAAAAPPPTKSREGRRGGRRGRAEAVWGKRIWDKQQQEEEEEEADCEGSEIYLSNRSGAVWSGWVAGPQTTAGDLSVLMINREGKAWPLPVVMDYETLITT